MTKTETTMTKIKMTMTKIEMTMTKNRNDNEQKLLRQ